jgi:hypothetical protein
MNYTVGAVGMGPSDLALEFPEHELQTWWKLITLTRSYRNSREQGMEVLPTADSELGV